MITLEASTLVAIAALITASVGFLAHRSNKKVGENKTTLDGANTAITGLDILAKQHSAELARISINHGAYFAQCELDKKNFAQVIAKHEGQIDVLKSIPLVNIDATFQRIGEFNEKVAKSVESLSNTSEKILTSLEQSAIMLAKDNVDKENKVEQVKTDLKEHDRTLARKVKPVNKS